MKFRLGKLVATPGAIDAIGHEAILNLVQRHAKGDWGEVNTNDWKENELSLRQGFRLLSAYTVNGQKVWVITEADRSATTVLLPDEY